MKYMYLLHVFVFHNRYRHSDPEQYVDPSSEHRLARVKQLAPPTDSADMLSILGDTWDRQYPIYRTGVPTDFYFTLTTGKAIEFIMYFKNCSRDIIILSGAYEPPETLQAAHKLLILYICAVEFSIHSTYFL